MKRIATILLCVLLAGVFMLFALGSGSSESDADQGTGSAVTPEGDNTTLGDYSVEIKSCRLAKDFEGKDVVIVKYGFTNNGDDSESFTVALEDTVYQNGIGLNKAYVLEDSANYSEDNQTKEIKKGATLDVEVAYELNDTTTEIEVEVSEWISWDDKVIRKKFSIV